MQLMYNKTGDGSKLNLKKYVLQKYFTCLFDVKHLDII
jgi:hypothetical protein